MYRLIFRLAGLVLIAGGFWSIFILHNIPPTAEELLDQQPDYDFTASARRLVAEKKYAEAKVLCQDIIENDLPGKKSAQIIIGICDEKLNSAGNRLYMTAKSFVTGDPGETVEQAGAAIISDMLMYGDVRDLIVQGYNKATGRETDICVAAFAAAGLASEVFDAVDWLPALFKALRKAGAVSDKMAKSIIFVFRKTSVWSGASLKLCRDMKDIYLRSGFWRTKNIFRHLTHAEDIAGVCRLVKKSPSAAHLVAQAAGKRTADVFRKLIAEKRSPAFVKKLLTKGPNGVTIVLRVGRSVKKGNASVFSEKTLTSLKKEYGQLVWLVPFVLIAAGIALSWPLLLSLKKIIFPHRSGGAKVPSLPEPLPAEAEARSPEAEKADIQ